MDEKLKSHFLRIYALMLADGKIDPKELMTLYEIGQKRGVTTDEINSIVMQPGNFGSLPDTIEEKVLMLYDLALLAWADGEIQDEERKMVESFCVKMGFPMENIHSIVEFLFESVKNGITEEQLLNELK